MAAVVECDSIRRRALFQPFLQLETELVTRRIVAKLSQNPHVAELGCEKVDDTPQVIVYGRELFFSRAMIVPGRPSRDEEQLAVDAGIVSEDRRRWHHPSPER